MTIRSAYERHLREHDGERDEAQAVVVGLLAKLQDELRTAARRRSPWHRLFGRGSAHTPVRGLYIWGGVGRGKTLLMDLFFETLDVPRKRRVHFHRIMQDVHRRLKAKGRIEDPLDVVAADIAEESRVLCFDEFFVSDIGDAMILGRLLEGLFRRGVTLVATSNCRPQELYRDGLQRQRFLPAIDAIEHHTHVVHLDGDTDYRLRLLQQAGTCLVPADEAATSRLERLFRESAASHVRHDAMLEINGRDVRARQCAKGIAWFDFDDICAGPRGQADYIEIARWYPTVIVSGVPRFDASLDDEARRFIALVDEFYDRRVKLIISAQCPPAQLYAGDRLAFEFERTASRLIEMQSTEYLHQPHLA